MVYFDEIVRCRLIADGWLRHRALDGADRFEKRFVGVAPAGAFGPDGARKLVLRLDEQGRYLERIDGWGKVEKDVDLREFNEAAEAIAAVLEA